MSSKLDQLKSMTVVVADTGDIEAIQAFQPTDCTTNPTLILKAAQMPAYAHLVDEAVQWGRAQGGDQAAVVAAVCDRLAVTFGTELSRIVPGRVSTEVDADLSFDTAASVAKGRAIIADYQSRGVGRERVLIKLASTWEGIRAAEILEAEGINCNLTLLFCLAQAAAAAELAAGSWLALRAAMTPTGAVMLVVAAVRAFGPARGWVLVEGQARHAALSHRPQPPPYHHS